VAQKTHFFEFLNQISHKKNPEFFDDETKKDWSTYMVLRYLSMDEMLLPMVNLVQQYAGILDNREMYDLLLEVIPRKKRFFKYVKGINIGDEDSLIFVARAYSCSIKEARDYVSVMGSRWAGDIQKDFGEVDFKWKKRKKNNRNKVLE